VDAFHVAHVNVVSSNLIAIQEKVRTSQTGSPQEHRTEAIGALAFAAFSALADPKNSGDTILILWRIRPVD
jgi:hypothetical protein